MSRTQRRRRIRCRLPCEVVEPCRRPLRATIVCLSEGGLALEVGMRIEQGDAIRLTLPRPGARDIEVSGIVWNDRPVRRARGGAALRALGCVVSQPPAAFLELLDELERRNAPPRPRVRIAEDGSVSAPDPDLPRSRAPLPPPKPEPEEELPLFRLRLKEVGGPRTRILKVRARSQSEAAEVAREQLGSDAADWQVLDVGSLGERA